MTYVNKTPSDGNAKWAILLQSIGSLPSPTSSPTGRRISDIAQLSGSSHRLQVTLLRVLQSCSLTDRKFTSAKRGTIRSTMLLRTPRICWTTLLLIMEDME